jgi:Cu2+-exporting ATPase
VFRLGERLRPGAARGVAALASQGLTTLISSGDAAAKVEAIAKQVAVDAWYARQLPADKVASLRALRDGGARVIAVGDGINDAPVLAGADVGIALAGSSELAQARSDIVLAGDRLDAIAPARSIARQTVAVIKQNHHWALAYNFTAIPLAALGFVPPWLAALGMSLSSLVVVLNLQRIGRPHPSQSRSLHEAPPVLPRTVTG